MVTVKNPYFWLTSREGPIRDIRACPAHAAIALLLIILITGCTRLSPGRILSFDSGVDQDHCQVGDVIHYAATARVAGGDSFDLKAPVPPAGLDPVGRSIQQSSSSTEEGIERTIRMDLTYACVSPGEIELPPFLLSLDGKDTPSPGVRILVEGGPGQPGLPRRSGPAPRSPDEQRRPPPELFQKPPIRI